MKNFYFVDNETGEDFIVEAENLLDAIRIACTPIGDHSPRSTLL